MTTHLAADLAVTLEADRPGTLAKAIGCISAAGINIDGYSEMNGVVHVLTTELSAARKCLTLEPRRGCFNGSRKRTSTCAIAILPPATGS
jgi:hypothetical protein